MELIILLIGFIVIVNIGGCIGAYKILKRCIREAIIEARLK